MLFRSPSAAFPREPNPRVRRWGAKSSFSLARSPLATERRRRSATPVLLPPPTGARPPPSAPPPSSFVLDILRLRPPTSKLSSAPFSRAFLHLEAFSAPATTKVVRQQRSSLPPIPRFAFSLTPPFSRIGDLLKIHRLALDQASCSRSRNVSSDTS